jgi:hypothetical protein
MGNAADKPRPPCDKSRCTGDVPVERGFFSRASKRRSDGRRHQVLSVICWQPIMDICRREGGMPESYTQLM